MATYFWVGGTGTWDASNTTNWSLTSGGLGGLGVPNSTDTVIFDSASGTGTCTTASGSASSLTTLNSSTLGLTLGDSHTMTGTFTLTLGVLSLGSFTLSCGSFQSNNANIRSIEFGTGNITLTGNGVFVLSMADATNFTYTGTPTINATYSGAVGTRSFRFGATGGTEAKVLNINISAGTDSISLSTVRAKSLNFTGFSGTLLNQGPILFGDLTLSSGMTLNAGASPISFFATSGTQLITTNGKTLDFPLSQNSPNANLQLQDNLTLGSTRTFTLTAGTLDLNNFTLSAGLLVSSNSNTRSIAFGTGAVTITGSGTVWNIGTVTGFTRTGTPTVNISNNSATATSVSTGAMTEAQSLNFNFTTGTYTLTDTAAVYRSVNFTGFAGTIPNSVRIIFGSLTLSAGMTLTAGTNATTFASSVSGNTITNAEKTQDYPIIFNGIGGTWAFQDALTQGSTRNFTLTNGTVQLKNGVTSTVGAFATSGTNQKFLQSTLVGSQATLTQASGTVNVSKLTIQDINATGGATWAAYVDNFNVDAGNNDGWDFGISPVIGGNEYTYQLRSFTQPRRF